LCSDIGETNSYGSDIYVHDMKVNNSASFRLCHRVWTDSSECLSVQQVETEKAFPHGLNIRIKSPNYENNKIILRDDAKRVFTVCSREISEKSADSFQYKILTTSPCCEGQKPAKRTQNSRTCFYDWAEVHGSPRSIRYVLSCRDGNEYSCTRHSLSNQFLFDKTGTPCGSMEQLPLDTDKKSWRLTVHKGINPCLLIVFALITNDLYHMVTVEEQQNLKNLALSLNDAISTHSPYIIKFCPRIKEDFQQTSADEVIETLEKNNIPLLRGHPYLDASQINSQEIPWRKCEIDFTKSTQESTQSLPRISVSGLKANSGSNCAA
jgi:hypothetical protein